MEIRSAILSDLERIIEINSVIDYNQPGDFMKKSIFDNNIYVIIIDENVV